MSDSAESDVPAAGADVRRRAAAAYVAQGPDSEPQREQAGRRSLTWDESFAFAAVNFASAATEMVKDILGAGINLKPGHWDVRHKYGGTFESGTGINQVVARVTLDGVVITASAEGDFPARPTWVGIDGEPLTLASFGRALAKRG